MKQIKFKRKYKIIEKKMFNEKAQAASVDALIFLSIVGIVFTFIIGYSMNYGLNIMNDAKKLYQTNYHYVALKTFMNAGYGRDGKDFLETNMADSLATMIKEDYGSNTLRQIQSPDQDINLISFETRKSIFDVLDKMFLPLSQRSYLLLITHDVSSNSSYVQSPLFAVIRIVNDDGTYKYFYCSNEKNNIFNTQDVTSFLEQHNLDLEFVEGKFIFYRNILSNTDGKDADTKKEDGGIYLASWLSIQEKQNQDKFLNYCNDWTNTIIR